MGGHRRSEAVVHVDRHHAGHARREHPEEGSEPPERGAVADARGDGDDRSADEPRDDRRKGALHPGDDDHAIGSFERGNLCEHPVEPGNADVDDPIDPKAERLGDERSFLRHGQIRRARRDHRDPPARILVR